MTTAGRRKKKRMMKSRWRIDLFGKMATLKERISRLSLTRKETWKLKTKSLIKQLCKKKEGR
jgi:hypothetical protein